MKEFMLADLASPLGDATQFSGDEDLLNIVAEMIVEVIQYGGTDAVSVACAVFDDHPELEGQYGEAKIAGLAQFLLNAELPGVSARLHRLFDDWLIHEMAHAATDGGHDEVWINEMKRLRLAGAPVLSFDID